MCILKKKKFQFVAIHEVLLSSRLISSDCRVALIANVSQHFNSTMGKDHTTTPGTMCPKKAMQYVLLRLSKEIEGYGLRKITRAQRSLTEI